MPQINFFDILPDTRWVEIKPDSSHKVYKPGQRFLVIEEKGDWLLCWRNGIKPPYIGTLINRRYVQDITSN